MTNSWDEYADGWDNDQDVNLYAENAFKALVKELDLTGLNILDFGCGTGLLTQNMAQYAKNILALDTSPKMISVLEAKAIENVETLFVELTPKTVQEHTSLSRKFDLITASSVLAFVPDFETSLMLLKSLLSQNGTLVQWDWRAEGSDEDFGFSASDLEAAYSRVGFNVVNITEPFSMRSKGATMKVIMCTARVA